ncbi:hypothetical protein Pmani_008167 [Petrolisthes manimaculis]|uniref:RING-type domain-containing protein n=1 Tax=Petrolisthes manimaculis TaxID=1843537 RepID=A0AAE1Q662_9EUCA|nr:hypothetical protein Pmani_008167 [Petrolisthes manimaculis]
MKVWVVVWVWAAGLAAAVTSDWAYDGTTFTLAHLNITYNDLVNDKTVTIYQIGRYANGGVKAASGLLQLGRSTKGYSIKRVPFGCTLPWDLNIPEEPWVALVARGQCADKEKIMNAMALNASAIVFYTRDTRAHLKQLGLKALEDGGKGSLGVVYVDEEKGLQLEGIIKDGQQVWISLTRGQPVKYHVTNINRTSVLFVTVSFIILMVISLAWLVFYYVQRFRYIHAKDRIARHLCNAAKKALAKIPVKNLKASDREVSSENECCAVCIEPYQVSEAVRTLPCKHEFHKNCVDPWLLEHRTCPMCKMDILKFYGYVLSESEESVLQLDMLEENLPRGDAEAPSTTTTLPPHTTTTTTTTNTPPSSGNTHISQVMVVPRDDNQDGECENWPTAVVPNTPITPVHQSSTSPPSQRSTSPGLVSVVSRHPTPLPCTGSATSHCPSPPPRRRSSATHSKNPLSSVVSRGRKASLQQVMPVSGAVPCHHHHQQQQQQTSPVSASANSETRVLENRATTTGGQVRGEGLMDNNTESQTHTTPTTTEGIDEGGSVENDVELSSIYSEEFLGTEEEKEATTVEEDKESDGDKMKRRASGNSTLMCVSSTTTNTNTTSPSSHSPTPSPTLQHRHSSSLGRSPLSPSKRKTSVSRSRSRSRKRSGSRVRSGSQVRSESRGYDERKREHSGSDGIRETEEPTPRPSSHVITVSHV